MVTVIFTDGPSRVATALLAQAERFGSHAPNGLRVQHGLTPQKCPELSWSRKGRVEWHHAPRLNVDVADEGDGTDIDL